MSWEIKSKNNEVKFEVGKIEHNDEWMQERYVAVTVESPTPINFEIGDYLIYRDERFEINYDPGKIKSAPRFEKGDAFRYENVKFNSLADELTRCDFLDVVLGDNQLHFTGLPKFSFYGGVNQLADRIQANLDKTYGEGVWDVVLAPEFSDTTELNVTIDTQKVSGVLADVLVNQFKTYYTIKGRTLTIGAAGVPADHLFKYGEGNGLYEIEENAEADQQIVTRLRAYGSTRNIPHRYYNSLTDADGVKLIPDNMAVQHLMLPSFPYTTQDPYIDSKNIDALGVREDTKFFDGSNPDLPEIYPSIEGMTAEQLITAGVPCNATGALDVLVSAEQMTDNGVGKIEGDAFEGNATTTAEPATFKVTIKDVGFDINDHLTTETATISFKTGMLGGRDFEIVECKKEGNNYALELNRVYDEDIKLWFPYKDYNAKTDDKFVLLNIRMPEVYIKAASQRLLEAAEKWLEKNDYSRSIYAPKIDENFMARQHDAAMASGGTIKSLHDTLCAGMQLLFEDEDLGIDAAIFIDRLTIIEGEGSIPTYEVVLKEEKTVGRLDKMQNQIDSLAAGQGQGNGGYNASQIRSLINAYGGQIFLSKLKDDRSVGKIASDKAFEVGEYIAGAQGAIIGKDAETGQTFGEMDRLFIRIKAYFETLTIINAETLAGKQYITPGGGIKCTSVVEIRNNQGTLTGWKCYFLSEQDGEKTETKMIAGDQAISEMFNAKTGTSNKVSNHRYWRLVTAVSNDAYTDENGNHYGYIELSASNCEAGSDAPEAGDEICQLGYQGTDKPERQTAMVFSTVDADAPSIKMYSGINSFSLNDKAIISFGRDPLTNKVYFRLGNSTATQYLEYKQDNGLKVAGSITTTSTIGDKTFEQYIKDVVPPVTQEDIEGYVNAIVDPKIEGIQNQIDGSIMTYFQHGAPTLSNYPANEWTDNQEKNKHLGDLYYDKDTGFGYRFEAKDGGGYEWALLKDTDIAKALAAAAQAQDTADGKRRTFVNTPVPPYDDGDIWVNATYPSGTTNDTRDPSQGKYFNDILRCGTAKTQGQSFSINDWGLASNYTDDTLAQSAKDEIAGYQYIKEAFKGASVTNGGLFLSTLIELGLWNEASLQTDHPFIEQVYAGLNGAFITDKSPMLWGGGDMIDRFYDANGNPRTTPLDSDYATSMIRMDGSAYFAGGNVGFEGTSGWFGDRSTGNAITFADGAMTFGNGIKIDLGNGNNTTFGGLQTTLENILNYINKLDLYLYPVRQDGTRTQWGADDFYAVKSVKGLFSDEFLSAYGLNGATGGAVGASALADLSDVALSSLASGQALVYNGTNWVNQAISGGLDESALGTYLTANSYATQQWVEGKGYLTSASLNGYATTSALGGYYTKTETDNHFVKALYGDECNVLLNMNEMWSNKTTIGSVNASSNAPGANSAWYNVIQIAHRNGVSDGPSYVGQIALGMTTSHDNMFFRTHRTRSWQTVVTSANISSYAITSHQPLTNYVTLNTAQTISALKTHTAGLKVSGRVVGGGDDEGIVIGNAANNFAGLILGEPSGVRSVFYLANTNALWRYNNGATSYDINHPVKSGTIALTSDISSAVANYLPLTGGTLTGYLTITTNGRSIQIGAQNNGYIHYQSSNSVPHWFNNDVRVQGNIYAGSSYNQLVWHQGNDGSGSGLDADLLDGVHNGELTAKWLGLQDTRNTDTLPNALGKSVSYHFKGNNTDGLACGGSFHSVLHFAQWAAGDISGGYAKQLALGDNGRMYLRAAALNATSWGAWNNIAFTTDNVASATRLQGSYSLWGQTFYGNNVSGNMTGVGHVYPAVANTSDIGSTALPFRYGIFNWVGSTTNANFNIGANYANQMTFLVNGNVGIGTTSPSCKLDVNGVIRAVTGIYTDGYVSAYGQNTSDARLKEQIRDFKATDIIMALRPRAFKWNATARGLSEVFRTDDVQYGLIAQETRNIAPWLVFDGLCGSDYMGVRYEKLIPVLHQGIREQVFRVDSLEVRVKRLEKENEELRREIKELKGVES